MSLSRNACAYAPSPSPRSQAPTSTPSPGQALARWPQSIPSRAGPTRTMVGRLSWRRVSRPRPVQRRPPRGGADHVRCWPAGLGRPRSAAAGDGTRCRLAGPRLMREVCCRSIPARERDLSVRGGADEACRTTSGRAAPSSDLRRGLSIRDGEPPPGRPEPVQRNGGLRRGRGRAGPPDPAPPGRRGRWHRQDRHARPPRRPPGAERRRPPPRPPAHLHPSRGRGDGRARAASAAAPSAPTPRSTSSRPAPSTASAPGCCACTLPRSASIRPPPCSTGATPPTCSTWSGTGWTRPRGGRRVRQRASRLRAGRGRGSRRWVRARSAARASCISSPASASPAATRVPGPPLEVAGWVRRHGWRARRPRGRGFDDGDAWRSRPPDRYGPVNPPGSFGRRDVRGVSVTRSTNRDRAEPDDPAIVQNQHRRTRSRVRPQAGRPGLPAGADPRAVAPDDEPGRRTEGSGHAGARHGRAGDRSGAQYQHG